MKALFYKNLKKLAIATVTAALLLFSCGSPDIDIYNGQGEMAGELTSNSVILQTRLTATDTAGLNFDMPGQAGVAKMEISLDEGFKKSSFTGLKASNPRTDYYVRWIVDGLEANTRYYYRVHYGIKKGSLKKGPLRTFKTLPGNNSEEPVSFVAVTGMNYAKFHYGAEGNPEEFDPTANSSRELKAMGFPAHRAILNLKPTFFVGTGDNVYYDFPLNRWVAKDSTALRKKWHEQFSQPWSIEMFGQIPVYWEKDDHDFRYNDCDTTTAQEPSTAAGKYMFLEQVPVTLNPENPSRTYRTFRINKHLQVWLVEGRDYRSPNKMPDGQEKSLWGREQLAWLKAGLLESDASYKILISPTPMVGPDDAYKKDNHVNHGGFRHEGESFFQWLKENGIRSEKFFIICGDRHWQYHARHPSGYEEFSTGAMVDNNSRAGRITGDPKSTDPDKLIHQYFVQGEGQASGGFLHVRQALVDGQAYLEFILRDENGSINYQTIKK